MIHRYLRLKETETVSIATILDDVDTLLEQESDWQTDSVIAHARLAHLLYLLSAGTGAGMLPVSLLRKLWDNTLAGVIAEHQQPDAYTDIELSGRFTGVPSRVWIN